MYERLDNHLPSFFGWPQTNEPARKMLPVAAPDRRHILKEVVPRPDFVRHRQAVAIHRHAAPRGDGEKRYVLLPHDTLPTPISGKHDPSDPAAFMKDATVVFLLVAGHEEFHNIQV